MFMRASLFGLAVLLFIPGPTRCDEPSAEHFGKTIVKTNMRLRNAGFEFGKQLGPILNGDSADPAGLARTYAKLVKTLMQAKRDTEKLKVPDSREAKNLSQSHQRFLQGQAFMIQGDLADVLIIAVDPAKDADEKKQQIEALLGAMTEREKADGALLLPALQAYVDAYSLDVSSWFEDEAR